MSEPRVDLEKLLVPLKLTSGGRKVDLAGSVTSGRLERTIEGASTVTLEFRDPDRLILKSGLFTSYGEGVKTGRLLERDIKLDGLWYRLVKVQKQGEGFTAVWEDRAVALLREANEPRKARRGDVTRAQFVQALVESVKAPQTVPFFIPQAGKVQPLAKLPKSERREKEKEAKDPGFDRGVRLTIKGVRADSHQLENLKIGMAVCDELDAPHDARKALLLAYIQEASARNLNYGHSSSKGILQLLSSTASALGVSANDVEAVTRLFLRDGFWKYRPNGAIHYARQAGYSAGAIAQMMQGSAGSGADYAKHGDEAEAIISAWGGGTVTNEAGGTVTYERDYYFAVGRPHGPRNENYWDATGRMAEEVGHRRFVVRGEFWWVSEEDLFRLPAQTTIGEDTPGVESIDFDVDNGKRVDECTVACRIERWTGDPGGIVAQRDLGPADGRWLISHIESDFFSTAATVTLRKPIKERPEPRGDLVTRSVDPNGTDASGEWKGLEGTVRERIVQIAKDTMTRNSGFSRYSQAGALTTDPTPPSPNRTDCSQWVRAVYLKAGAGDPGTYTGAQIPRGRRISIGNIKPGDLMISSSHVELYIGGGQTIGHGSPPIDFNTVAWCQGRGMFPLTYDFLDDNGPARGRTRDGAQAEAGV